MSSKTLQLDEFATIETPPNDNTPDSEPDFDAHGWNQRIAALTSAVSGILSGIPAPKAQAYREQYQAAVTPLYDEFGMSEALYDMGIIGGGVGEDAPAWVKLLASAGAAVYVGVTLRGQYGGGSIPASNPSSDGGRNSDNAGDEQQHDADAWSAYVD